MLAFMEGATAGDESAFELIEQAAQQGEVRAILSLAPILKIIQPQHLIIYYGLIFIYQMTI